MKIKNAALAVGGAAVAAGFLMGAAGATIGARALYRRTRKYTLQDKVVLITGGSRGLGLALAEEFAARGARLAICARDKDELSRARTQLERGGTEALDLVCDVGDREDVGHLVEAVHAKLGRIDVLVNAAGIIAVGPLEEQKLEDFEEAMKVNFWGVVNTTFAVLPEMKQRGLGRIVNITSIGGKISVPHLLPYSCAKFAAVAFSEGVRAEIRKDGILVTTIVPGLMRTGSHLNASFKGNHQAEFRWFSMSATSPLTAMAVQRAARQIVNATIRGKAELILGWQAELVARLNGLFPELTSEILALVNRSLPKAAGGKTSSQKGWQSESTLTRSPLTALGRWAARRYNEAPTA